MVEWKKLGEVCEVYDGTHQTPKYTDEGIKFVSVENITNLYASNKYISKEDYNRNYKTKPQKNDVLMTRIGDVGTCAVIKGDEPIAFYVSLSLLRPNRNKIISNYIKYILESQTGKKEIRKKTLLTAVPLKINLGDIGKISIPLPSLSEQERIVGILDTFTFSIENLKAQISLRRKQYEHYRDKLLDLEGKPGVEMKTLGDFADVTKLAGFEFTEHITYKEYGKIIALRGLNVRNGHLDLSQVKFIDGSNFSKLERSKLLVDDMLFTYVGTIGNVALIDEDEKYYLAPNVSRIRFNKNSVVPRFALYTFLSQRFHRTQISRFLNSSSMKNLTMENIRKFVLPLPSLEEQSCIVSILDEFEASIKNLEAQLQAREKQYEYYRNKLLTFE